ncbi:MAG: cytochrome c [Sulfuritalea sp.]|jgi:mono/diheme cytochrome c family protein|nr:cytochrome c [Sulfuritalea sp.]
MHGRRFILAGSTALLMVAASGSLQAADGAKLYEAHCVACHQPDGNGAEGLAPPLAGVLTKRAQSTSGREYLAQVLVSGMIGTITSRGVKYNGNMPAATLSDEELVAVMGHVLATFNGVSQPLPVELFIAARGKALAPSAVRQLRERVLAEVGE